MSMRVIGRNIVIGSLGLLGIVACAPRNHTAPGAENDAAHQSPEQLNHTPFPAMLAESEDEHGKFFAAIIKVTLVPHAPGLWRFDQVQEEITNGSVMSSACPTAPDKINDVVPFRKKAEVYLLPNQNDGSPVTLKIGAKGAAKSISFRNGCRVFDSPADLILTSYPDDGTVFSVSGLSTEGPKTFIIPEGLTPFVIVRYKAGQVIFTPTRLDTVTLDAASDRAILVYRATFPMRPEVRKVEYAAVLPKEMRPRVEPVDLEGDEATVQYLKKCPKPTGPIEPCSLPTTPQNPALFGIKK
jgi:hypothetical protein